MDLSDCERAFEFGRKFIGTKDFLRIVKFCHLCSNS